MEKLSITPNPTEQDQTTNPEENENVSEQGQTTNPEKNENVSEQGQTTNPEENETTTNQDIATNTEETEKPERVFFGKTKDGADVYDRPDSHFHSEGGLTPELLKEALETIDTADRPFIKEQVNFDHPIGKQSCVTIGPDDDVVMVYRKGRSGPTPMVKNRKMQPCNSLIVILGKNHEIQDKDAYNVITCYIGSDSPREPWDPGINTEEERQESEDFWRSHALIYNDDLIDWEKTKEVESMSESDKEAEAVRQRTFFAGVFIDPTDLNEKKPATLEKPIKNPHITTAYRPGSADQLHLEKIGNKVKIFAIAYGNDGKNEGLLVKIESDDPEIQAACDALETPHITLSISSGAQARNTAFLEFTPLENPFELTGKFGLNCQGELILDQENLTGLKTRITSKS